MTPIALRYRLARVRCGALAVPSAAPTFPLMDARDHARICIGQPRCATPVWLHHAQYFALLSALADALWQALGEDARFFIEARAPFNGSLPSNLLDPRILLGAGLRRPWETAAGQAPAASAWITDTIRRDLDHAGDNTLTCLLPDPRWSAAVDGALARCWPGQAIQLVRIHEELAHAHI